ncbi:MAG: hypothetical protein ACI39U_05740 [Candidatus Cryptobacteroides sp.]
MKLRPGGLQPHEASEGRNPGRGGGGKKSKVRWKSFASLSNELSIK